MKRIVLMALTLAAVGATTAYAASPETVAGAIAACCDFLAACCDGGSCC
ncbi:MAG: hypothetical protein VX640_01790 [Pseudomonadota bacterium]|nr:hypothetical protein [Pseudomonadota bacterium]